MGGVLGVVTEPPKNSAKNARMRVDVSGLEVGLKFGDVLWSAAQPDSQQSTQSSQLPKRRKKARRESLAQSVRGGLRGAAEDGATRTVVQHI